MWKQRSADLGHLQPAANPLCLGLSSSTTPLWWDPGSSAALPRDGTRHMPKLLPVVLAAVWGLHTDKQHREIPSTGRTLGRTKSGNTSKREAGSRERLGWEMTSVSCLHKLAGPLRDDLKRFGHGDIPLLAVRDCLGRL